MADVVSPQVRSRMMAGIQATGTKPEMVVRRILFAHGIRYRLHRHDLPGKPDIVLVGRRVALFVHGCFWHQHEGCSLVKLPASNRDFWLTKLRRNQERDMQNVHSLIATGWRVRVVWECRTRRRCSPESLARELIDAIEAAKSYIEISA